jgi:hypothetical protein
LALLGQEAMQLIQHKAAPACMCCIVPGSMRTQCGRGESPSASESCSCCRNKTLEAPRRRARHCLLQALPSAPETFGWVGPSFERHPLSLAAQQRSCACDQNNRWLSEPCDIRNTCHIPLSAGRYFVQSSAPLLREVMALCDSPRRCSCRRNERMNDPAVKSNDQSSIPHAPAPPFQAASALPRREVTRLNAFRRRCQETYHPLLRYQSVHVMYPSRSSAQDLSVSHTL